MASVYSGAISRRQEVKTAKYLQSSISKQKRDYAAVGIIYWLNRRPNRSFRQTEVSYIAAVVGLQSQFRLTLHSNQHLRRGSFCPKEDLVRAVVGLS